MSSVHISEFKIGVSYRPTVTILAVDNDGSPTRIRLGGKEYQLDDDHYIKEPKQQS